MRGVIVVVVVYDDTFYWVYRARNNGRSTDNVRTDWGVDQSTFRLAGHVDRSQSIVLKTIVISMWQVAVHCETLI